MLYLYGVVRSGHPLPRCQGVGSPPRDVGLIEAGPLAAAVSELPDEFEMQDEDAPAHLDVLVRLLQDGPVVPLRMGTVAPDEAAIKGEVLEGAAPQMLEKLDALDGLVELLVDADDDEREAVAEIARTTDLPATAATDLMSKVELGREVAELLVDRRRQLAEEIVGELRPLAVDDVPRAVIRGPEDPVLRWTFLVKREAMADFDNAVAAARSRHPSVAIHYAGPLPPAHFIERQHGDEPESSPADSFSPQSGWGW